MLLPKARRDKLIVRKLPDETLVYDQTTARAHCLNGTASLIWKNCDGRTSSAELSRRLDIPEAVIGLALEQLNRRHLLQESVRKLSARRRRSRRDLLRKIAVAALPVIMTMTAPRAAQAASGPCPSGQTMCSGHCTNLQTDPNNCGTCGAMCLLPEANKCGSGRCCIPAGGACPNPAFLCCPGLSCGGTGVCG